MKRLFTFLMIAVLACATFFVAKADLPREDSSGGSGGGNPPPGAGRCSYVTGYDHTHFVIDPDTGGGYWYDDPSVNTPIYCNRPTSIGKTRCLLHSGW